MQNKCFAFKVDWPFSALCVENKADKHKQPVFMKVQQTFGCFSLSVCLFSQQRLPFSRGRFLPRLSLVALPQVSPLSFSSALIWLTNQNRDAGSWSFSVSKEDCNCVSTLIKNQHLLFLTQVVPHGLACSQHPPWEALPWCPWWDLHHMEWCLADLVRSRVNNSLFSHECFRSFRHELKTSLPSLQTPV